jgi:hypothetical protein
MSKKMYLIFACLFPFLWFVVGGSYLIDKIKRNKNTFLDILIVYRIVLFSTLCFYFISIATLLPWSYFIAAYFFISFFGSAVCADIIENMKKRLEEEEDEAGYNS